MSPRKRSFHKSKSNLTEKLSLLQSHINVIVDTSMEDSHNPVPEPSDSERSSA